MTHKMMITVRRRFSLSIRHYINVEIWQQKLTNDVRKQIDDYWSESIAFANDFTQGTAEKKSYVLPVLPASECSSLDHFRLLTVSESIARFHRSRGKNVHHPVVLGETAAKCRNYFPYVSKTNETTHIKWTQYLFLKLFNAGLAYKAETNVSFDSAMQPVDCNLDAVDPFSTNGTEVFEKIVKRWFIRTSAYDDYSLVEPAHILADPFSTENIQNKRNVRVEDSIISEESLRGVLIPIIHCAECGSLPVPENQLPVLPPSSGFKTNESLGAWINTICPKCGNKAFRENDSLNSSFSSSWNYLRYVDANNESEPFSSTAANQFLPVDFYVVHEHDATTNSILAQFWCMYFNANGSLAHRKPFARVVSIGPVSGEKFVEPVERTSGNVRIEPDEIINIHGIDTARLLMCKVPPRSHLTLDAESLADVQSWQNRLWSLMQDLVKARREGSSEQMPWIMMDKENAILRDTRNRHVRETTLHYHNCELSAVVDNLRKFTNVLTCVSKIVRLRSVEYEKAVAALIIMVSPVMPRFASTLWLGLQQAENRIGNECDEIKWQENVTGQKWPELDVDAEIPLKCLINDKLEFTAYINNREVFNITDETVIKVCRKVSRVRKYLRREDIVDVRIKSFENLSLDCRIETKAAMKANLGDEKTSARSI